VTHYGDKLPAQEAGRTTSTLNKQGVTVKRNDPNEQKNKTETDKAQTEQTRRDTALLASYTSEEEIDIARDRNLKMDEFSLQSLYQRIETLKREEIQLKNSVALFQKRNKPVPDNLTEQIKKNQFNVKNSAASIIAIKKSMTETRQRFDNDKLRYAELKPRNQEITDIKYKKKTLAELQDWKNDTQNRLNKLNAEVTETKRAGRKVDETLTIRIQNTTDELRRANDEIETTLASVKRSEQNLSKKTPVEASKETPIVKSNTPSKPNATIKPSSTSP
jgi:hypothetical protein